jgi:hypothetical protein
MERLLYDLSKDGGSCSMNIQNIESAALKHSKCGGSCSMSIQNMEGAAL